MIIKKNKELIKNLNDLFKINEENMALGNLLFSVYTEMLPECIEKIKQYVKEGKEEKSAILSGVFDFLEINDDEEAMDFISEYASKNLFKLDFDYYLNNEYAKTIKNIGKYKDCSLQLLKYEPYQIFAADDIYLDGYIENNRIGYFNKEFQYLALLKNNEIWMSLNPNEIKTMEPYINKAKGNALVLGLGMGYVAFMMALKAEVQSVTIVEKDPHIINIFNNLLWPDFKNKNKIRREIFFIII